MIPSGEPTRVIFGNISYGWLVYIFAVAMAVVFAWAATGTTACGDKAKTSFGWIAPGSASKPSLAMASAISA
jgi:hypothetical protein